MKKKNTLTFLLFLAILLYLYNTQSNIEQFKNNELVTFGKLYHLFIVNAAETIKYITVVDISPLIKVNDMGKIEIAYDQNIINSIHKSIDNLIIEGNDEMIVKEKTKKLFILLINTLLYSMIICTKSFEEQRKFLRNNQKTIQSLDGTNTNFIKKNTPITMSENYNIILNNIITKKDDKYIFNDINILNICKKSLKLCNTFTHTKKISNILKEVYEDTHEFLNPLKYVVIKHILINNNIPNDTLVTMGDFSEDYFL